MKLFHCFLFLFSSCLAKPKLPNCEILDLTHTIDQNLPYFPAYRPINLTTIYAAPLQNAPFMSAKYLCTFEHMGTHIDAPNHFTPNKPGVDKIPLKQVIGEGCVIDISNKTASNPDYALTITDLEEWEAENGRISRNCIVLLHTGWDRYFKDAKKFLGSSNTQNMETLRFPSFSGPSAFWLVTERHVKAVGVDTLSLDVGYKAGGNFEYPAHRHFLNNDVVGLEMVANLNKLPSRGSTVFAAPIKLGDGTGAPARVFALGWQGKSDPCHYLSSSDCLSCCLNVVVLVMIVIHALQYLHLMF